MSVINKSAIVFFSAKKMFNLVDSIEEYPQFLSWCGSTKIIERNIDFTTASIEIAYKGIRQIFTTKNTKKNFDEMVMTLVDGPFKKLSGVWKFKALDQESCKINLDLEYEFNNSVISTILSPVFDYIAKTFIDEFIQEANRRFLNEK